MEGRRACAAVGKGAGVVGLRRSCRGSLQQEREGLRNAPGQDIYDLFDNDLYGESAVGTSQAE